MSEPLVQDRGQTPAQRRPLYRLPLLKVVCGQGVGLVVVCPAPCPVKLSGVAPFVAIVDDRSPSQGPDAFDLAPLRILLRRARGALVLTGDCARSYVAVAFIAARCPVSMVLVETTPDHGEPWRTLIQATAPGLPVVLTHN